MFFVSVHGVKVSVRVRRTGVDGVELTLAVEDAPALSGKGGHAEPAESAGQASRFFLTKGRGPPVSSHPDSGRSKSKMGRCRIRLSRKPSFKLDK